MSINNAKMWCKVTYFMSNGVQATTTTMQLARLTCTELKNIGAVFQHCIRVRNFLLQCVCLLIDILKMLLLDI